MFEILQEQRSLFESEFRTLVCEATAVVNNRPITLESLETPDSLPLSPNFLLTMKEEPILPPPGDFEPSDKYSRRRWRTVQFFADEFWKTWVREYLSDLQKRSKWNKQKRNVQVGDLVWVQDEMRHRSAWPLARVLETTTDKDGLVRRVRLQLKNPSIQLERPIHKLVMFIPVDEQMSN